MLYKRQMNQGLGLTAYSLRLRGNGLWVIGYGLGVRSYVIVCGKTS